MLDYHHEFVTGELQWLESPNFDFVSGTPDYIYRTVDVSQNTYVESP